MLNYFNLLPYLLIYVPDQHKTPQMCDKAILENSGTLNYVPDCYKNQEMCNKAVEGNSCIRICSWMLKDWKNVW